MPEAPCGNFAIGSEAAEAEENADKHGTRMVTEHVGSVKKTISTIEPSEALLRTIISSRCGRLTDEEDEVKIAPPSPRATGLPSGCIVEDAHGRGSPPVYRGVKRRRRRLLESTLTELRHMAALAMAGLEQNAEGWIPKHRRDGMPSRL